MIMTVEVSVVRKRLLAAVERARVRAQQRRQRAGEAERAYTTFLDEVATPVTRMMATALKAEGYPFTVAAPSGGLRLVSDHGRDDYIEFLLDTTGDLPQVMGRVSRSRGSRTLTSERPVKTDASPDDLTDEDVVTFLAEALEPWLER